jgi:signal transduction histidine kinase
LLDAALTPARMRAIVLAAIVAGAGVIALVLTSDHQESKAVWAVFGPAVGWNFVGTGLYAWRRRPESRIGVLMVLLGFAWFLSTLNAANSALVWTAGLVTAGLWGGVFLHLAVSFPTGRLESRRDRLIVIAGYVLFPLGLIPALLFAGREEIDCDECPDNLFLIERNADLASFFLGIGAVLYVVLFVIVLVRSIVHWRSTSPLERLQLTPVYVCALLTFLLVVVARVGDSEDAWWAAFVSSALLPFAFLGGLLRSRVSQLDAELRARLEELRASRARVVQASDAERRRLERDLHDGAQSRLVALALVLRSARARATDPELAALLDTAQNELKTSLAELRELARGIHPAILTERGLEPALQTLVSRVPLPVELQSRDHERLPGPVECAAYFVVSEALANVAKYAHATHATVEIRRVNGRVTVEVTDDGVGGADAARGSGLRGLADRVAALDGTLALDSPAGKGTRLRAEIPFGTSAMDDGLDRAEHAGASA